MDRGDIKFINFFTIVIYIIYSVLIYYPSDAVYMSWSYTRESSARDVSKLFTTAYFYGLPTNSWWSIHYMFWDGLIQYKLKFFHSTYQAFVSNNLCAVLDLVDYLCKYVRISVNILRKRIAAPPGRISASQTPYNTLRAFIIMRSTFFRLIPSNSLP